MKVKTSELTGPALDWAVTFALGFKPRIEFKPMVVPKVSGICIEMPTGRITAFSPSTDWSQGGPIIERERVFPLSNISTDSANPGWDFLAMHNHYNVNETPMFGPTPLIAAMRCYVTSKLGDEVEIPDELTVA